MKRLQSTETLGSTSAINSDKTGTLTLNQMTAVQLTVIGRRYAVEGAGYATDGQITRVAGQPVIPLDEFLLPMVLASDAVISGGELVGDPTEGALVALAAKGGVDAASTRQQYPRIAELPFDAAYKLMATFHTMRDASGRAVVRCFVKGAPDQLLARAATVYDADAGPVPANGEFRERFLAENQRLGEQGLRVLATARKDFDPAAFDSGADLLPLVDGLELLSLVGIVDPPRPAARESIATAKKAGIRVRMITGDHAVTAEAIARQLGIDGQVITGPSSANFTTLLFQAIGLGYGVPGAGLMERGPRQPDRPILTRGLMAWLVTTGLVMGVGTLGVISWAEQARTQAVAHTMGVVTFSLYALFFSVATRDEHRTAFSLDTLSDRTFNIATGVSLLTLILATVLGPLESLLETTPLDVQQWLICSCVALSVVLVSEIRKAVLRRPAATAAADRRPAPGPSAD
jgi:magnesium-transporting ATPase (P-type)